MGLAHIGELLFAVTNELELHILPNKVSFVRGNKARIRCRVFFNLWDILLGQDHFNLVVLFFGNKPRKLLRKLVAFTPVKEEASINRISQNLIHAREHDESSSRLLASHSGQFQLFYGISVELPSRVGSCEEHIQKSFYFLQAELINHPFSVAFFLGLIVQEAKRSYAMRIALECLGLLSFLNHIAFIITVFLGKDELKSDHHLVR